jgi:uncharacterized protein
MFDAEDMFGAQRTYEAIEQQSPGNNNHLLLGPWTHGAWARGEWTKFGPYTFGQNVNSRYAQMITDFFNANLKGNPVQNLPEATVFFTGTNEWKTFAKWPAANTKAVTYFLNNGNTLATNAGTGSNSYVSNPAQPVPYISGIAGRRRNEYLVDDQQFAQRRNDVLTYVTEPLAENTTIAGRIHADLLVSLSAVSGDTKQLLDADFVVKVIDVLPDTAVAGRTVPGPQQMVRADVFRGKFRNIFEKPEGFVPDQEGRVQFDLNDAAHTFLKGHRIMVQVQSSWFPIVDRNPQKFMRIPDAEANDFIPVKVTVHHAGSKVTLPILP